MSYIYTYEHSFLPQESKRTSAFKKIRRIRDLSEKSTWMILGWLPK